MEFVPRGREANVKGDGGSDGSGSPTHGSAVEAAAKRRKVDVCSRRIVHESGEASADSTCVVQCDRCEVAEAEVNSVGAWGEDERCVSVDGDDTGSTSCCSRNESSDGARKTLESLDLEGKRQEVDATTTHEERRLLLDSGFERERKPHDESARPDENSTRNPPAAMNRHRRQLREGMPMQGEIDDFFSAAETNTAVRFKEKYNFDFDKGEPLEGRYEWRPLIPAAKDKEIIKA